MSIRRIPIITIPMPLMLIRSLVLCGLAFFCVTLPAAAQQAQPSDAYATARVLRILGERDEEFGGIRRTVQDVELRIDSGPYAGETIRLENGIVQDRGDMRLDAGDRVTTEIIQRTDGTVDVLIRESHRLPRLGLLTAVFVLLAVVLGGWTGVRSLAGLGVSVLVLLLFVIPRIVAGNPPLLICLIGASLIACLSLYTAHGMQRRTTVALIATILTLLLSMILAIAFVHLASLFGMGSEESMFLQIGRLGEVDLRGLLLGGMLLGCLGVLDDITTAQCAVVDEISKVNPSLSPAQLRLAGASVGREHIASLINTLALAYAGASLPLLLLLDVNSDFPLWMTLNSEFLAEEIVRTLVGSMALLMAVPISTWLASVSLRAAPGSHPVAHASAHSHHHHG